MASEAEAPTSSPSPSLDPRVKCRSRSRAVDLLGCYEPVVGKLGAGQAVEAETLEQALGEALWNFESAVRENVTINGQPWQESSDALQNDTGIKLLEDQLDELIVDVASKRNQYPREVQVQVVRAIKAQQKLLDCCQPVMNSQEIKAEPSQDSYMADLSLSTKIASRHVGDTFKTLSSLIERAEGFSKALSFQPTLELCKVRQQIVSASEGKKETKTDVKDLTSQVEVIPPQTAASNSVLLKIKRRPCSPQKRYPIQQRKIRLDT
ncbi:kinetochore-associated protein NSL1 homolog [Pogona vitticeps]